MTQKQKEDWYWQLEGVIQDLTMSDFDVDVIETLERVQLEILHYEEEV